LRTHLVLVVSIILFIILFKPALSENDYVDQVDLGNSLSENSHNVIGRGWAESPQFNPYTSLSGDNSKRYMTIGEDCSLDMHIKELNVPYTLNFEVEDGNCDDSFGVLVGGNEIYPYIGKNKGTNNVEVRSHMVPIPAAYAKDQTLKITFRNVASDDCGKAAVYNVKLFKGEIGVSSRELPPWILSPVDGPIDIKRCISCSDTCNDWDSKTAWRFHQHKCCCKDSACDDPCDGGCGGGVYGHGPNGGIRCADDTYAWDINLLESDDDCGLPVYAVYPGKVIEVGGNSGQVLIEHDYKGKKWWSAYLHMDNFAVSVGDDVSQNTEIGHISNKAVFNIPYHLHFAVYSGSNTQGGLISFDTEIKQRGDTLPLNKKISTSTTSLLAVSPESDQSLVPSPSISADWAKASRIEIQTSPAAAMGIAFSPDGRTLASGGSDGRVRLWDTATGAEVKTLGTHPGMFNSVESVAFSPDGLTVASGSEDSTIRLWDVASGSEIRTLTGHSSGLFSVAFSPDGRTLASGSSDKTAKMWDLDSGSEIRTLSGHSSQVWGVAFSPDGQILASGSADGTIKLWDTASGSEIRTLTGHRDCIQGIAFSSDGHTLASGSYDYTIKLWDVASGSEIRTLVGHSHVVNSVAFSPDGSTLVSGSSDNTVKLWDTASGSVIQTFTRPMDLVFGVAFSPDGRTVAAGCRDNRIYLWKVT
jgi:WD40 repeat protein